MLLKLSDREKEIEDDKLKALHEFTKVMNESRGNPTPEEAKKFLDAGPICHFARIMVCLNWSRVLSMATLASVKSIF